MPFRIQVKLLITITKKYVFLGKNDYVIQRSCLSFSRNEELRVLLKDHETQAVEPPFQTKDSSAIKE